MATHADLTDTSSSSAVLALDFLVEQGQISIDRARVLKEKFKALHDRLMDIYNVEPFLMGRTKALRRELTDGKATLQGCMQQAQDADTRINALR
eukprot:gene9571-8551_t